MSDVDEQTQRFRRPDDEATKLRARINELHAENDALLMALRELIKERFVWESDVQPQIDAARALIAAHDARAEHDPT